MKGERKSCRTMGPNDRVRYREDGGRRRNYFKKETFPQKTFTEKVRSVRTSKKRKLRKQKLENGGCSGETDATHRLEKGG